MKLRDYYQVLGVTRSAGVDEIKKRYRLLARRHHPDISPDRDAEARMKEINEAYAVLSDPTQKAAYDRSLAHGSVNGDFGDSTREFSPEEVAGFNDAFTEIWTRMGGNRDHGRAGFGGRGTDRHARIEIDVEDAWTGSRRLINLRLPRIEPDGSVSLVTHSLQVAIPQGVTERQTIRLAGLGEPGVAGGAPGDLYLEVHFSPHPRFRLDGRDLHLALPVAPWEAALGAEIPIKLPSGRGIRVRIPPGAQAGRQLKVAGKGLPGDPPGDLYLEIRVVLPPADRPGARALYQRMARELDFDPRDDSATGP